MFFIAFILLNFMFIILFFLIQQCVYLILYIIFKVNKLNY